MAARWTGCSSGRRAREMRKSKRAAAGDVARDREWMVGATRRHRGRGAGAPGGYKRNAAWVTRSTYSSPLYVRWLVRGGDEVVVVRSAWHYSTAEISRGSGKGGALSTACRGTAHWRARCGREGGRVRVARASARCGEAGRRTRSRCVLVGWLAGEAGRVGTDGPKKRKQRWSGKNSWFGLAGTEEDKQADWPGPAASVERKE